MRAGMQRLLELLREQPPPPCVAESEWLDALAIADEENLLPLLAARLSAFEDQLPPSVSAPLAEVRRTAQQEAFLCSATLKHMLSAFHERGIPVISLKGPWLAERLYGDAALRSYSDLDLLVRPRDWAACEHLMSELGFSPCVRSDDRHRSWRRAGFKVEAHFRLANPLDFDVDTGGIWNRAQLSEFRGVPAWLLAPSDELLFLCLHAVYHCFERLRLVVELSSAFRQLPLPNVAACGQRGSELESVLALSRLLVRRFEGYPSLTEPPAAWLNAIPRLERVADRIWQRCLLHQAAPTEWQTSHRLYLAMEARAWPRFLRRIRHSRNLLTRFIDADFELAARFHLRRNWQVWILRQFRLLPKVARLSLSRLREHRQSLLADSANANLNSLP